MPSEALNLSRILAFNQIPSQLEEISIDSQVSLFRIMVPPNSARESERLIARFEQQTNELSVSLVSHQNPFDMPSFLPSNVNNEEARINNSS